MIHIEQAEATDLETIIGIQRASFKAVYEKYHDQYDPYLEDRERIKWKLVERLNSFYYFVKDDEEIVGFLRLQTNDERTKGWLGTAAILPQYQRKSYGYEGIRLLEKRFPTITQWDLCTVFQDEPMVKFYEKCGYHQTHTEPEQEGMDMVYMTKSIKRKEWHMNTWQELTIMVSREAEEAVSNILIDLGSQGVAIDDSADYLGEAGPFGEVLPQVEQLNMVAITAYYPETANLEMIRQEVKERLVQLRDFGLEIGETQLTTQQLAEEDWADNWKKYFEPARITHDLTIVPSWTDYEVTTGEKIIKLDPGMAFGTGTHPTTKMSLFALEQVLRGGETVLDVGTGSGVLSIASSLLGAKEIFAYDLDDVAVRVAQENIALNAGTENIHVAAGDLLKGIDIEADVIVANILADILVNLTDDAYRLLKDEGYLIMSGIISEKWNLVRESAEAAGFFLETHMIQGEWNACVFKKTKEISGVIGG